MVLNSYAKINLTLKVNTRNKNKLHEIQSYFCLINLADKISIKKIKKKKIKSYLKALLQDWLTNQITPFQIF